MRALFNIKRIIPTHEERSCEFFHWKIAHDLHQQCIFAIFSHIKEMKCGEAHFSRYIAASCANLFSSSTATS